MTQAHPVIFRALPWLTLVLASLSSSVRADDYTDVSRLLQADQLPQALTRVEERLGNKPNDPQMRFFKGLIESRQGRQAEAIATLTQLTRDYPELPEPHNNLAVLYAAQGQYDQARAALEMAVRTNPGYAIAHENLGDVYAELARQAYDQALKLDSNNTTIAPKLKLMRDLGHSRP